MAKKKGKNRVGLLLDETGSMAIRKQETIVAVNNYFDTLREEKALVTFATFDTAQGVNFRHTDVKAKEIDNLTDQSYKPNAMTPLHDAVGKMISQMRQQAKPGDKVLITVVTDGEENSSTEFNLPKVQALINQCEKDGWAFSFIGASADAWHGGARMGVVAASVLNVDGNQMVGAMNAHVHATKSYFSGRTSAKSFYDKSRHLVTDDS